MSMIGDAFAALQRLMLMDSELKRIANAVQRHDERLDSHHDRLSRIESLIEFSGYGAPPPHLLPPRR